MDAIASPISLCTIEIEQIQNHPRFPPPGMTLEPRFVHPWVDLVTTRENYEVGRNSRSMNNQYLALLYKLDMPQVMIGNDAH